MYKKIIFEYYTGMLYVYNIKLMIVYKIQSNINKLNLIITIQKIRNIIFMTYFYFHYYSH